VAKQVLARVQADAQAQTASKIKLGALLNQEA
jgi:hypothetical protein